MDKLLTIQEVADYIGCHKETVYRMIRDGRLPAINPSGNRLIRVRQEDLEEFLNGNKYPALPGQAKMKLYSR